MSFIRYGESMKNKSFWQSVKCAIKGIKSGFACEKNFKIYLCIGGLFLILNILLSAGPYDYVLFLISAGGVFATEYINTAIERVCDRLCREKDKDIGFVKDVAAAAVLVSGIAFFGAEGIILISKLL